MLLFPPLHILLLFLLLLLLFFLNRSVAAVPPHLATLFLGEFTKVEAHWGLFGASDVLLTVLHPDFLELAEVVEPFGTFLEIWGFRTLCHLIIV